MNQASFTIKTSTLLLELKKMTKSLGSISKWNRYTVLELTITDGLLTLVIPGIRIEVKCETNSTAKASLGMYYFRDIINTWNKPEVECFIYDNSIKMGITTVRAQTTFFETDSILRSINLPINYSDLHLLRLEQKGFTPEEIDFNQLEYDLRIAKRTLKRNILKAKELLMFMELQKRILRNYFKKR